MELLLKADKSSFCEIQLYYNDNRITNLKKNIFKEAPTTSLSL